MTSHCQIRSCSHYVAGHAQRPRTAMAAIDSRYQQHSSLGQGGPSPPASPSQQTAYHSNPAKAAHQTLRSWPSHAASVSQQLDTMPSVAVFGQQQQQADAHNDWLPSAHLAGPQDSAQQDFRSAKEMSGLQLPMHVQQWLASLASHGQLGVDQPAAPVRASSAVPSPDAVQAATEVQENLRQLRAELADVKAKLTDTQVCPLVIASQTTYYTSVQVHELSKVCCMDHHKKWLLGTMLILSQEIMLNF